MSAPNLRSFPNDAVVLDSRSVDAVAQRVVELLVARQVLGDDESLGEAPRLLTPAELALQIGRQREWIYEHAAELGVIRLGAGPRPRLFFDPRVVEERLG